MTWRPWLGAVVPPIAERLLPPALGEPKPFRELAGFALDTPTWRVTRDHTMARDRTGGG